MAGVFPWFSPFNVPSWLGQVEGDEQKKLPPNAQVQPTLPGQPVIEPQPATNGEEQQPAGQLPITFLPGPGGGPVGGPQAQPRPSDRPMGQSPTGGVWDAMFNSRLQEWGVATLQDRQMLGPVLPFDPIFPSLPGPGGGPGGASASGSPWLLRAAPAVLIGPGGGVQSFMRSPPLGFSGQPSMAPAPAPFNQAPPATLFQGSFRTTSGATAQVGGGWWRVTSPTLRTWTGMPSPGHVTLDFVYQGRPSQTATLESGGVREQIALRAGPDQMNQFIVAWRADGTIKVEVKSNPGISDPVGDNNATGYYDLRPTNYQNAAPLKPGERHQLYYTIQGDQLTVLADGQPVWVGKLDGRALELARGEQNVRTDNWKGDFALSFGAVGQNAFQPQPSTMRPLMRAPLPILQFRPQSTPFDGVTRWQPSQNDQGWVDVRAYGARGDGVSDDTMAFRRAAATGKNLYVPRPPGGFYRVSGNIPLRSSVFGDGTFPQIRMHGANGDPDQGDRFNVFVVKNHDGAVPITINGLHLHGGWDGKTRPGGEWSHGVRIDASRNVHVTNNIIEAMMGDSVYVGSHTRGRMSQDVTVFGNRLQSPFRTTVAVVGGERVQIVGNMNYKPTDYVAVIDLETDPLGYQVNRHILVEDNVFQAVRQHGGTGPVNITNWTGNPEVSDIIIRNNRGQWGSVNTTITPYGTDFVTQVNPNGGRPAVARVTVSGNTRGSTAWDFYRAAAAAEAAVATGPQTPFRPEISPVSPQRPNPQTLNWGGWAWGGVPTANVARAGFSWFEVGYPRTISRQEADFLRSHGVTPFAYINMGEVTPDLRGPSGYRGPTLRHNAGWNTDLVDVTNPTWQAWLMRRSEEAYQNGLRGIKFDVATPDIPPGKTRSQVTDSMVRLLQEIKRRMPDMKIVLNQGYDIALKAPHLVDGLQEEGLLSAGGKLQHVAYLQPWKDPYWWGPRFEAAKRLQALGVPVIVAEYADPRSQRARDLHAAIRSHGFIPYITDVRWQTRGWGNTINPGW